MDDVAQRVRRYAVEQLAEGCDYVFSSDVVDDLGLNPQSVARALRPFGVTPSNLGGGLGRGYLAGDIVNSVPAPVDVVAVFTEALGHDATGALQQAGWNV